MDARHPGKTSLREATKCSGGIYLSGAGGAGTPDRGICMASVDDLDSEGRDHGCGWISRNILTKKDLR